MRFDVLTLFPEMCEAVLGSSIIGRAQKNGIVTINAINIRDFTEDKHRRVDDYPYGGGNGMVMQPMPIWNAYRHYTEGLDVKPTVIYMSPQGKPLCQETVKQFAKGNNSHYMILCGHYEGIDERIIEEIVDIEISLGDFVLTGGEIPAIALIDAVCRLIPGVLSEEESFTDESHFHHLLEYPQYTRPPVFLERKVPEVLLSGHHANIVRWHREQSLYRTLKRRPDLLQKATLSEDDHYILKEFEKGL